MDWFTLRALAADWDAALRGARFGGAWTQSRGELSLALTLPDRAEWTLRVLCDPALPLLFRTEGAGRQRRNTADVFDGLDGHTVAGVRAADRDRFLFLDLDSGDALAVLLFGSRPNVLWLARPTRRKPQGYVREAFLRPADWEDEPVPVPRPAADPRTAEEVRARWPALAKSVGQAVRVAAPLVPVRLADAAVRSAGLDPAAPHATLSDAQLDGLAAAVAALRARLDAPAPAVLWRGGDDVPEALLPVVPEPVPDGLRPETFESADAASRVYARRALATRGFLAAVRPAEAALAASAARRARSAEAMADELAQPSRADRYEAWGHLLMALAGGQGPGQESVTLPDVLSGTEAPIEIPLDPSRSAIVNAERYYDRARRTRRARAEAEARWAGVAEDAEAAAALLARLRTLTTRTDVLAFLQDEKAAFTALVGREAAGDAAEPFRRVPLPGGFEALVGKNAKGNAELTTRIARPHDLWLHARGVPGAHVVVRRPSRTAEVPAEAVEVAARAAAYYSDARPQALAPVSVAERKHVRPVKGGAPGAVRLDREKVLLVAPGLP
ncbi:MAG TPA: NFACT family protein [Rubricoccaceae bacterium]